MTLRIVIAAALLLGGCGYGERGAELIGQVKRVSHTTPIICPDYDAVDISLGVLRNGVGSMSTQDMYLTIINPTDIAKLRAASESGALVRVVYSRKRIAFCFYREHVDWVEVLK